jgi:uncharacterized protein (TIGR03437 family)
VVCLQPAFAQTVEWRAIGNRVIDRGLAGLAGGPVSRVWYDGAKFRAKLATGATFETSDFETWTASAAVAPASTPDASTVGGPEPGAQVRMSGSNAYAFGNAVYRSADEGRSWEDVTRFRGVSIIGDGIRDLAVSPNNPEEIAVATDAGLWRSLDGGLSWTGLNEGLPNLPASRLLRAPGSGVSARIEIPDGEVVWLPGRRSGWAPATVQIGKTESALKAALSRATGWTVSTVAVANEWVYAGGGGGRLAVSPDQGRSWRPFAIPESGDVASVFVHQAEPRVGLAAIRGTGGRVVRTINGGLFWEEIGSGLPAGVQVNAVTADLASNTVYAATSTGLWMVTADLLKAGPVGQWTQVAGLPQGPVLDVKLDDGGNQIYALAQGYGVYGALAPHRLRDPRVVNAADYSSRPAAPGTLLSVLGSKVASARAGQLEAPVLAASDQESQIQVPFGVTGTSLSLTLASDGAATRKDVRMALQAAAPAIFVDRDGTAMILDADRGILLDAMTPARAGARIQILATGLGRVTPDWPTGMAAPADNVPKVVAPVKAYIDRVPVEVTRATLAPGYVGFYLIEVQVPEIVNNGPAEFYLEVGGQDSGRVSLQLLQ